MTMQLVGPEQKCSYYEGDLERDHPEPKILLKNSFDLDAALRSLIVAWDDLRQDTNLPIDPESVSPYRYYEVDGSVLKRLGEAAVKARAALERSTSQQ